MADLNNWDFLCVLGTKESKSISFVVLGSGATAKHSSKGAAPALMGTHSKI